MKKPIFYSILAIILITSFYFTKAVTARSLVADPVYLPLVFQPDIPLPTATSTPAIPLVLPNYTTYYDSIDYLHIVGEVFNNTNSNLIYTKIAVDIFDSTGHLVATDYTYTLMDTLPAKDKTCFEVILPAPASWSYFNFETVSYHTSNATLPNLTVNDVSGSYDLVYGWYDLIGIVANNSATTVNFVEPVGTLYDANGYVIGCDFTFVNSTNLLPGQSSAFHITFLGRNYNDVASYRLQVDGNPQ